MRTVVVRGGWRAWALLGVAGLVLLVLGLVFGLVLLALLVMATALILGQRVVRAFGLGNRSAAPASSRPTGRDTADAVIEGTYRVVDRPPAERQLSEPRR